MCEEKGIKLIHIYDLLWKTKKEIFKSMIKSQLGYCENKIYARKCEIREISIHDKNLFLNENHLQGKDKSRFKYGLFYNNELISVMTFTPSRYNKNYKWELSRFATKKNCIVIGSFSKLLSHFKNLHHGSIISYADRTHSNGNVYIKNGFKLLRINPPQFYWIDKNFSVMYHRSKFTKSKALKHLNRPELTAEQIAEELGFTKTFECGTLTFVLE